MKIRTDSFHYRLLADWWEIDMDRQCRTLCQYFWHVVMYSFFTLALAVVVGFMSWLFATVMIAAPLMVAYSLLSGGLAGDGLWAAVLGLALDACVAYFCFEAYMWKRRGSDENSPVLPIASKAVKSLRESWIGQAFKDFKEKRCSLIEYVEVQK
ncbi:membrane protein [Acidovorax phage ACP17]|uniref:Uncharacterized protein n=1 Tax=Acidovorax phage ACP17 TaxID=2010329 RepID=A0A218M387_9CAUD|nr:membrane protein [Acidovorax phage ACP17]ASD50501.1 hypothetical protein [Acidovorax phage ACP17]